MFSILFSILLRCTMYEIYIINIFVFIHFCYPGIHLCICLFHFFICLVFYYLFSYIINNFYCISSFYTSFTLPKHLFSNLSIYLWTFNDILLFSDIINAFLIVCMFKFFTLPKFEWFVHLLVFCLFIYKKKNFLLHFFIYHILDFISYIINFFYCVWIFFLLPKHAFIWLFVSLFIYLVFHYFISYIINIF